MINQNNNRFGIKIWDGEYSVEFTHDKEVELKRAVAGFNLLLKKHTVQQVIEFDLIGIGSIRVGK